MDYSKFRLRSLAALQTKYCLTCGSAFELPFTYCIANSTDTDRMYYCYDICAIPINRNPPRKFRGTLLRICSKQTFPGFARLLMSQGGTHEKTIYYRRPQSLSQVKSGGPAITETLKVAEIIRTFIRADANTEEGDYVYAIYCPYWLKEADEWKIRKRNHGWPDEELIARVIKGGCHLVSKLFTWESCDDTEWRFSFSKAELILIHSWTDVQKYVYHAVRLFKKQISKEIGVKKNQALQTYFFKTLMFWAVEDWPREFWSEKGIGFCIAKLMNEFHRCLINRRCCHYFIPEINIMSHLTKESNFEKDLELVRSHMEKKTGFALNVDEFHPANWRFLKTAGKPLEIVCLNMLDYLFPLSKRLNGRIGPYLSECEWFLPEMNYLHQAIEKNLSLMSLDSVISRRKSDLLPQCLENFNRSLIKNYDFVSFSFSDPYQSFSESMYAIFRKKQLKNSVPVYRRGAVINSEFEQILKNRLPAALYCITSSYKANLYYTALQSDIECCNEFRKCLSVFSELEVGIQKQSPISFAQYIPILICNSYSQIFDEHLQVILGFATLHKYFLSSDSVYVADSKEVCLKLSAWEFLKYLYIQCEYKLSVKPILSPRPQSNYLLTDPSWMSQLRENVPFSSCIFYAALRQSKALDEPMSGLTIPDHSKLWPQFTDSCVMSTEIPNLLMFNPQKVRPSNGSW